MIATGTDGAALLKAICSEPWEDSHRLVFADWLDENGRSRYAAFIHREVARAATEYSRPSVLPWRKSDGETLYWGANGKTRLWRKGEIREACESLPAPTNDEFRVEFSRGFPARLTLSAADWLRIADTIAWRPEWTAECSRCGGDGKAHGADRPFEWNDRADYGKCVVCWDEKLKKATGRVPRPFLATAQPIEAVTLTSWPASGAIEHRRDGAALPNGVGHSYRFPGHPWHPEADCDRADSRSLVLGLCGRTWPGIDFTGPPDPEVIGINEAVPLTRDQYDALLVAHRLGLVGARDVRRQLGIPDPPEPD